jgi:hypothetical protein
MNEPQKTFKWPWKIKVLSTSSKLRVWASLKTFDLQILDNASKCLRGNLSTKKYFFPKNCELCAKFREVQSKPGWRYREWWRHYVTVCFWLSWRLQFFQPKWSLASQSNKNLGIQFSYNSCWNIQTTTLSFFYLGTAQGFSTCGLALCFPILRFAILNVMVQRTES